MLTENDQILLIDDDPDVLEAYRDLLAQENYQVVAIADPVNVIELIPEDWPGIIVCDVWLPKTSGLLLLEQFLAKDSHLPVLLITGHGDVPMAVEAVKKGAFDFLEKPIIPEKLLSKVELALVKRKALIKKRHWQSTTLSENLLGSSQWIIHLREQIQKLAYVDLPVVFFGEIGTGRHLAAEYLHRLSERRDHPLVVKELLPDSHFNLEQLMTSANKGTLVLNNIHHLSWENQLALSNIQQSDKKPFRLIVLCQNSLAELATEYKLVPELYYLLSLTQIEILPLSRRTVDIAELFKHYAVSASQRLNRHLPPLSHVFLSSLAKRAWPGNVRELINTAELYAVGLLPATSMPTLNAANQSGSLDERIENYERKIIEEALNFHQGRINDVAAYLGIPRKKLYLRMKKHGLDKSDYRDFY